MVQVFGSMQGHGLSFILCGSIFLDNKLICTHAIEVVRKREPQLRLLLIVDDVHVLLLFPLLSLRRWWKIVK